MIKYEKDLYEPVKKLFEENGYAVKGEIKDCDLTAVRDNEIIICELKLKFNLKLIYQLLDRRDISPAVYAAVTAPKRSDRHILKLMKALDFGLIYVSETTGIAQVIYNPMSIAKRDNLKTKSLKREFDGRRFDSPGGVNKTAIMTAYKEQSIRLLCYLEVMGEARPKILKKMGLGENVQAVLYNNFYGWFVNIKKGVYGISEQGRKMLKDEKYREQVEFFRREVKNSDFIDIITEE